MNDALNMKNISRSISIWLQPTWDALLGDNCGKHLTIKETLLQRSELASPWMFKRYLSIY